MPSRLLQTLVSWTPTLITLDSNGKEHYRTVGFLPPEELIPSLLLGMSKIDFNTERCESVIAECDKLLASYSKSMAAPEAIYLRGVCRYKKTHNPKSLKDAYEQLSDEYPDSEWTKRHNYNCCVKAQTEKAAT
jgi:outer membrane protein assembly factor BamD (BamD/ComL family)